MKRTVVLLGFALAILLSGSLRLPSPVAAADTGGILRWAMTTMPQTLDPALVNQIDDIIIAKQIYDGLTELDSDLQVIPAIASSWSASPDAKTWTFNLRRDVRFHNGRSVTASDFVYSWNRVKNTSGPWAVLFNSITTLSAPSDFTLVVGLVKPDVTFPNKVTTVAFAVVPSEAAATLGTNPVGTGAFKFVSWTAGSKIVLERNSDYFKRVPALVGAEIISYPDLDAAWADFQAGRLDLTQIPTSQWNSIKADPNVIAGGFDRMLGMGIDNAVFPDVRVRQAFGLAINRAAIVADPVVSTYDPVQLATGVVLPGTDSYNNSDILVPYDPDQALRLLAAAGWRDTNGDGILDNGAGTNLQITMVEPTAPNRRAVLQAIVNNLANIGGKGVGVAVTRVPLPWNAPGVNLYWIGWARDWPDAGSDLLAYAHNLALAHHFHYKSAAFDLDYDTALATFDESVRNAWYHSAEVQLINADATYLPFFYDRRPPAMKKSYVHGLHFTGTYGLFFSLKDVHMTKAK